MTEDEEIDLLVTGLAIIFLQEKLEELGLEIDDINLPRVLRRGLRLMPETAFEQKTK